MATTRTKAMIDASYPPYDSKPRARPKYTPITQGKTRQSEVEDADIRTIVKRWRSTGQAPMIDTREPFYGNFNQGDDFAFQLNRVIDAQTAFDGLPAAVRKFVGQDIKTFVDAMQDVDALEVMQGMGLRLDPEMSDRILQIKKQRVKDAKAAAIAAAAATAPPTTAVVDKPAAPAATATPPSSTS